MKPMIELLKPMLENHKPMIGIFKHVHYLTKKGLLHLSSEKNVIDCCRLSSSSKLRVFSQKESEGERNKLKFSVNVMQTKKRP